jgi:hypothetical protein
MFSILSQAHFAQVLSAQNTMTPQKKEVEVEVVETLT